MVLGADVTNSSVSVRAGKALPFEPGPGCRLHAALGQRGRLWWASPYLAGSYIWKETARSVIAAAARQTDRLAVLIVGDSDTGKSSLCTYLANTALSRGIVPCIIDGDIGQGDIAPPSAIGAAVVRRPVTDLRDLTAESFGFVGSISPAGIERLIADTICSLYKRTQDTRRLLIINTDGYARNGGAAYKRLIAEEIGPDMVVMLGGRDQQPLADALSSGPWRLASARPSEQAIKSWTERRWRRHDQFLRFVGEGQARKKLEDLTFSYLGSTLTTAEFLTLFSPGNNNPITTAATDNDNSNNDKSTFNLFVGLGLEGNSDKIVGFGVIKCLSAGAVEIRTDVENFDTVGLSNIVLTDSGAEQISPC